MSAGLHQLLNHWAPRRDQGRWVLGTIYRTEGPSYRKAGAMLLLNDAGERWGLLSGGCLEADIARHALRLMETGGARTVTYDTRDEGDVAYQLGLGCGGAVEILLQHVSPTGGNLGLDLALQRLQAGQGGALVLDVPYGRGPARGLVLQRGHRPSPEAAPPLGEEAHLRERAGRRQLVVPFRPEPALLVVGGGVDARPLVEFACQLGWQVSLCDPRPAFARARHFPEAVQIHRCEVADLSGTAFDAAVVMSHNLAIDAQAITWLRSQPRLRYLGLLGPRTRMSQVLELADVAEGELPCRVHGPAGLDLGGELPADIALSILAQCQACLHGRGGAALADGAEATATQTERVRVG